MTSKINSALETIKAEKQRLTEQLQSVQNDIQTRASEIETLRNQPISLEDFREALKSWVDKKASEASSVRVPHQLIKGFRGSPGTSSLPWATFEPDVGDGMKYACFPYDVPFESCDMTSALCFLFPENVLDRLMTSFEETVGHRWGNEDLMPVAQRRERVHELEGEIDELAEQASQIKAELAELG
ncbi:MAG: hypothetical protein CMI09_12210 [Oceanospirillaceae bacterium]|nr:hypothetical protein [Oceanospirillaceae bacterium]|tara:strand:- start:401 stop:955 length:555 start_codon:yes stop_codon:yes gene_type:complete